MRHRRNLVDLVQRAIDEAPPDDRDWLVALDVACDVQTLEWAMAAEEGEATSGAVGTQPRRW